MSGKLPVSVKLKGTIMSVSHEHLYFKVDGVPSHDIVTCIIEYKGLHDKLVKNKYGEDDEIEVDITVKPG